MRAVRSARVEPEHILAVILVLVSLAATVAIVAIPTLAGQVALLVIAAVALVSMVLAYAGRVMNAAWVIVLGIYLLDPLGSQLRLSGIGVTSIDIVALAPVPFVLTALWIRPESRGRLVMLAPLVLMLALAVLSLAWSPDTQYGFRKLTLWLTTGLVPIAYIVILASPERPVSWRLIGVAAFAYCLLLLAVGTFANDLYPGRLVFFDGNPIWIARAAFVGVLVVLFGPFPPIVKIVMIPPMLLAGHLTDSLGPTLGLILGAGVGLVEAIRIRHLSDRREGLAWAGIVLGAAVGLTLMATILLSAGSSDLTPVVDDPSVTSRATYVDIGIRVFTSAPVFGAGLGAFAATGADLYPHNLFLEVASELGLIGLLALVVWLAMAIRGALGSPLMISLIVATSIFTLFSGSVGSNAEFWLFTGIAVAMTPIRARSSLAVAPATP